MTKTYSTRVKAPNNMPAVDANSGDTRTNDDVLPNPPGRSIPDSKGKAGNQTIKCKIESKVAFQNVRTIQSKGKRAELASLFKTHGLKILGIADHKIVHNEDDDKVKTEEMDGCTLITTSAWRNNNNAACGGVGLVVSKRIESALMDIQPVNERILCAHFSGNPTTTIVIHYAPTEGSDTAEKHYEDLTNVINSIPKHNIILVIGDCNAHIGKESAKYTYHEKTNKNGKLLLNMVEETNMVITNTKFQKRKGKLWTFISDMTGSKTQIDFILVNQKWKNSVKNVEAYNTFSSIGSDHRIITAHLKLSLRTAKTPTRRKVYEWMPLRSDKDLQELYSIEVRNRYTELSNETDSSITSTYQNLIKANEEAANKLLAIKKRSKKKVTAEDTRIMTARKKVNDAFAKYEADPSIDNHQSFQHEKEHLKSAYNQAFEEELEEMIKQVETADERARHSESWRLINQITGRTTSKKGIIRGKSKEDRIESWHKHFSELLGNEPKIPDGTADEEVATIFTDLGIKTEAFSMEEYQKVKRNLKTGKSAGEDGIVAEVLKYCNLDDIIMGYANKLLTDGEKPQQWSDINIIPLPKSGDLSSTGNYRGIGLSAVVAKIVNKMLLNRIQPKLDHLLRPNQNGFRPGRSTTAHILALRRIIEGVKRRNLQAVIVFVDFSKAFDSVHRGKMLKILKAYGIPEQLVHAIRKLYEGTRAKVLSPDGETAYFNIKAGVLQGDTLAPYLFAIVIDYLMRKAISGKESQLGFTIQPKRSRRTPSIDVTDLDFADDIALISNDIRQAKELLQQVETEAAKVGLHVNAKKTEVMPYNQEQPVNMVSISGGKIKEVKNFKYLGGWMESSEKDIQIRKALAWVACHKLRKIWSSSLKNSFKIRLFLSTVESVLLYNSGSWTLTKQMEKSLNGMYTRMLRMVLNVSWKQHMTNEELYGGLHKITEKIAMRRLRLAGHCIRHPEEIASNLVLWEPTRGRPNRGRKPTDYIDLLKRDTGLDNTKEIQTAMLDRSVWKGFVTEARSGDRPK